ncbi:hypothetical protein QBC35DRAFT_503211 [Podospora australis]|uniref:T6SS Phospholipase effector Tle1-like catalytic domain-containing protein n=1 Tax=Podospora australis TaxID=1536484 RepID=A0AAN7AEI4_9PEZI|nr:hypothetical protein QBC35DRAFT_503211 [Podospora australis]
MPAPTYEQNQEDSPGNSSDLITRKPKKLILCFDGTGNEFTGSNADTNVIKLFSKLDRADPDQFHYYQTGIGTYDPESTTVDKSWLETTRDGIASAMDQGFGSGFDHHVLAGYRFLMRYYSSGDKIYMFGFSRGAYTAKFLARMIHTVGLLCRGNEEMVPFAYRLYCRYLAGDIKELNTGKGGKGKKSSTGTPPETPISPASPATAPPTDATNGKSNGVTAQVHLVEDISPVTSSDEIEVFSSTFCRKEQVPENGVVVERNIKVYFLGLWDCVNSVAVLEQKAAARVPVKGTARYVRHAVAVDERRVKFKPALMHQDHDPNDKRPKDEDIKEVWFPGCHGDVGGGWPASREHKHSKKVTLWQRVKNVFTTRKGKPAKHLDSGPLQMSDIPLAWMIREVELVGQNGDGGVDAAVKWREDRLNIFKNRFAAKKTQALEGFIHDSLRFGYGTGFFKVLFWNFLEYLPIIKRWELVNGQWENIRFPLNAGANRDIPHNSWLHESLRLRLEEEHAAYEPKNNHGDGGVHEPCLKHNGAVTKFVEVERDPGSVQADPENDHRLWTFAQRGPA